MDIEQIIRAVFKADASAALAGVGSLDKSLSALEDQALAANAAVARSMSGGVDPKMADRMAKARLDAARISAPDWGLDEIAALERELKGLPPIKDKIDIDPAMQARLMESQLVADELADDFLALDAATDKVGKSSTKAAGGLGKLWQGAKSLANILPGLGMGGLIGGAIAAIEALFDLLGGNDDKLSKFGSDAIDAANSVAAMAGALGDVNKELGKTFVNLDKDKLSNVAHQIENAKNAGNDELVARLTRERDMGAAQARVDELNKRLFDMEELRRSAAFTSSDRSDLQNRIFTAQGARDELQAKVDADWARNRSVNPLDKEALAKVSADLAVAMAAKMDAQNLANVATSQEAQLRADLATAQQALDFASRGVGDIRFGEDLVLPELPKGGVNVNVANAKFTINQRVTTNDPGELAGGALISSFRSLTNRVIRPEGMTAPTGRAR